MEAAAMLLSAIASNYSFKGALLWVFQTCAYVVPKINKVIKTCFSDQPIEGVLRALIFSRPNSRALSYISNCLRSLSQHYSASQFLDTICHRSSEFVSIKESIQRVQYSAKSCPLQMYAVLLQTEFTQFRPLSAAHLSVLTTVTQDTLLLLDHCFQKPVTWIFRRKATKDNSAKKDPCLCYAELVCACIVLVHLSLRQWVHDPKCIGKIVSTIQRNI